MENKQKKSRAKYWRITLLVLLLILLLLFGSAWMFYQSKLNKLNYNDGHQDIDTTVEMPMDSLDIPDLGDAPEHVSESLPDDAMIHDEDVMNILLLGTDERSNTFSTNARADSIMLLSLNLKKHTIKLVSIERGIGVPIEGRNDDWITHTFRYGGAALTLQTVRDCFKIDVDRYIRINFNIFEQGINAIGGIDINLTQAELDYLGEVQRWQWENMGKTSPPLKLGINHVDGDIALQYGRLREIDSDWKRIQRQRNVIQAALNQAKTMSLSQINNTIDTFLPMVMTNLTKSEITDLLLEIPGFLAEGMQIEQMTIPTRDTCWNTVGVDGRKLIGVDFAANTKILNELLYGD